jgi:hypothetical protein
MPEFQKKPGISEKEDEHAIRGFQNSVCPNCGWNEFYNSWGMGNAQCVACGKEFDAFVHNGRMKGRSCSDLKYLNLLGSNELGKSPSMVVQPMTILSQTSSGLD